MFIFDAKNIVSYEEFNKFVNNSREKLKNKKEEVLNKYNIYQRKDWDKDVYSYQSFRKEYREYVLIAFKEVIHNFNKYLPKEHIVILEGSYARNSDRIFSDIDYTLIYNEDKTEKLIAVEELINLSLSIIFDIPRDRVHSIFTYLSIDNKDENYSEEKNKFKMIFADGEIQYKCRKNTLKDVVRNLFSVRDYSSFLLYLENQMKNDPSTEWLYSFKIIENTTSFNLLEDIKRIEKQYHKIKFCHVKEKYVFLENIFSISHLKKVIKYDCLDNFYLYMSQIRKVYQEKTGCYKFLDIDELLYNNIVSDILGIEVTNKLKSLYIEYLVLLNRIEITLNKRNMELSSHCYLKMSKEKLEKYYFDDWNQQDIITHIMKVKNTLFTQMNNSLSSLTSKNLVEICTFPCSPRIINSIEKCLLYLVGSYLGKIVSNSYSIANFNVLGMKNNLGLLESYKKYIYNDLNLYFDAEKLDIDFKEFAIKNIKKLIERKIIIAETKNSLNCPCGMVELFIDNDNHSYLNPNLFTIKKNGNKEIYICNRCGKECVKVKNEALFLKFSYSIEDMKKIDIYPEFSKKQFIEIVEKRKNNVLMISRKRETGVALEIENKTYNIDVDFVWQFLFLLSNTRQTIAITGYREIFNIFLSSFINNLCFKKDIKYLTIPMVQSDQSFSYELSRDVENMAYFLSTKINKQKTQLTNSTKIALSKKKTLLLLSAFFSPNFSKQ